MRTLIVGVNGSLGHVTASSLLSKGVPVDAVFHERSDGLPEGLGDRLPTDRLESISGRMYDVVLVTAGFVPYGRMDTADPRLAETNVGLVLRVCRAFPRARVVLASSVAVYGTPAGRLTERAPFDRPTLYGLSKLGGEAVVRQHASYAAIRFSSLYGPGMAPSTFLPLIIHAARTIKSIEVWGDGSRRQDYLNLADAAAMMIASASLEWSGVLLGVSGKSTSNLDVARLVAACFESCEVRLVGTDTSPSFDFDAAESHARLQWSPAVTLDEGIRAMVVEDV